MDIIAKNQTYVVEITGTSHDGCGIAKIDGFVVFIPATAVGDLAETLILKVLKNYAFGKLVRVIEPSKDRIKPDCPVFLQCGGCCYRHISYEAECRIKFDSVIENVRKIAGMELPNPELIPAVKQENYRNKALIPVGTSKDGTLIAGFFARHSHRIVPTKECKIQPPIFQKIADFVLDFAENHNIQAYNEISHSGLLRYIYLRIAEGTGEIMLSLILNGNSLPNHEDLRNSIIDAFPNIASLNIIRNTSRNNVIVWANPVTNIYGKPYIVDRLCEKTFCISPHSFYQVNHDMTEKLYSKIADFCELSKKDSVIDLYCGIGTIGISLADLAGNLLGLEITPQAVMDATSNAELNGITNAHFFIHDAKSTTSDFLTRYSMPTTAIIDPPRKGVEKEALLAICNLNIPKLAMISCNSSTLARDLAVLASNGYRPQKTAIIDLFPRSSHVECVVLMSRIEK